MGSDNHPNRLPELHDQSCRQTDAFNMTSRYDVAVQPGQTPDIGNLNLAVCSQPTPAGDESTLRQDNHD
jgi:hypothetical protein